MFVRIAAGAVAGIDAVTVSVEVNVAAAGQLGLFLVGLPDNAVKESEQRIRSAFENTGLRMTGKKLVVNLAPADLRKEGAGFDLPIAVGILAATEQVPGRCWRANCRSTGRSNLCAASFRWPSRPAKRGCGV